jgi:hypothetical protein
MRLQSKMNYFRSFSHNFIIFHQCSQCKDTMLESQEERQQILRIHANKATVQVDQQSMATNNR